MTKHLILVRHSISQPQAGVSAHEWPLTDEGREKVALLVQRFYGLNVCKVLSSDEPKASETARLLADGLGGLSTKSDPDLRETYRKTAPYYANHSDFKNAIRTAMQNPKELMFGEETFEAAQTRFSEAVARILSEPLDGSVVIVSHGTILALYLSHLTGLDAFSLWDLFDMPAYAVVDIPTLKLREICFSVG